MGESGRMADRSIKAAGMSAGEAEGRVVAALGTRPALTSVVTAPGRIQVSRTSRPRWAIVATVLTAPLLGLGLLFLLVKRTDSGAIVIVDGPTGCVIALPTVLDAADVTAIETAITGPSTPHETGAAVAAAAPMSSGGATPLPSSPPTGAAVPLPPPPGMPPATPAPMPATFAVADPVLDDMDGRTIARAQRPPSVPPAGVVLRFDTGETIPLPIGERISIGRDPSGPRPCAVPGESRSVSKTHLALEFDGNEVVVEDLHSTNGSSYRSVDGEGTLAAGTPTRIRPDATLTLGDLSVTLLRT